ncbi:MAG: type I DNA topoisomerase [Acidobacteriota bacterium]
MSNALVIVESPAKAKTIEQYLGPGFQVESSIGHVRDLPQNADDIPARYKKEKWARLGVNVDDSFKPLYVVNKDKKAQVKKLKKMLEDADLLYLATDEDREGEAIAWHLVEVLKPKVPVKRMVFGEITKTAITRAVEKTREIDSRLVNAQEARRVLDRLYGYELSPVLWKKVKPRLSAGRVQSVATRLVVERERERMRFKSSDYWDVEAKLRLADGDQIFDSRLREIDGKRLATGRDFDDLTGKLKDEDAVVLLDEAGAKAIAESLSSATFRVASVQEKPFTRKPSAPFITSTLQQEAARKLRFTAQRAMQVAQRLYENGYITYMRTDSTNLSTQAVDAARDQISQLYGADYLPSEPRVYRGKSKNAQEAHEAIRPAGRAFRTPAEVKDALDPDAFRLYELIWKRTVASQMTDARGLNTRIRLDAPLGDGRTARFAASGTVIEFPGFMRAYIEGSDDRGQALEDQDRLLPAMKEGDAVTSEEMAAAGHTTQPPARFTEASLVKELEERGIGRPSTYATILRTIQARGYVFKKGSALVPTWTAFAVTRLLEKHMGELVDFSFTARMEDDLDEIARGEREAEPWLRDFYFGDDDDSDDDLGLKELIGSGWEDIDARSVCSLPIGKHPETGDEVVVRVGRYGPYLQVGDTDVRVTVRDDIPPDELTVEDALEMLRKAAMADEPIGNDPGTGKPIYVKTGRYGDYVQLGDPEVDDKGKLKADGKPKMASLWPDMSRDTLTVEQALMLLSFPKDIGPHPETGEPILVQDGPYGPYVKSGKENRSLENHAQMQTLTVEQAVTILAQPKRGRRAAAVMKELGEHPETELALVVKNGRFGPYVTDGVVNASVPKGRDFKTLTLQDGVDLIAAREEKLRDQGKDPRAPAAKKKATKKKVAKKKAAKKKATKRKSARKKTVTRKSA